MRIERALARASLDVVARRDPSAIYHRMGPTELQVLTPDFNASDAALDTVLSAHPHIFNHNLETVRRLTPAVRSRAGRP